MGFVGKKHASCLSGASHVVARDTRPGPGDFAKSRKKHLSPKKRGPTKAREFTGSEAFPTRL